MKIKSIFSVKSSIDLIGNDLLQQYKDQFGETKARLVIFFSTSNLEPQAVAKKMSEVFADSQVIGCTTAGELTSGHMLKNSIVAMLFDEEAVRDVSVGLVEDLKRGNNVEAVFKNFESHFGPLKNLDFSQHVGLIFVDGMSGAEEKLMSKIGDLTDLTFVGGSAGDDARFKETYVFANGKAYTDAAVLAVLKVGTKFEVVKTQSFEVTDKNLVATKVDEENRTVLEFDKKPAVTGYADALGVAGEEIQNEFMTHPVGLMVDKEPYVRSPQQVVGANIKFYCNVKEGAKLSILNSTNIVEKMSKVLEQKRQELGGISAIINFSCILRALELEKENKTEEYGKLFSDVPTVGFNTYGEQYIGHMNQTSTMVIFK